MNFLKHITVIVICIGITVPKDVLIQLGGIPALFQHFLHHNHEHESISFIDFAALHYAEDLHHDDEDQEHKNLPCDHHHSTECFSTVTAVFNHDANQLLFTFSAETSRNFLPLTENFYSSYFQNIWQPPKIS